MRLLVAGASGRTGRLLVSRALARGHEVTALVRDPSAFPQPVRSLRVVVGDVLEPGTLSAAVAGQDAIVSVIAPRPRKNGRVYIEGTRALADAAASSGVRRFVAVSAEGAGAKGATVPFLYRLVMRIPVVARLYPDIARMEDELRARTDVDWTIVRPAILTNQPATGTFRTVVGPVVPRGLAISRADLAVFLLDTVEGRRHVGEVVAVAD